MIRVSVCVLACWTCLAVVALRATTAVAASLDFQAIAAADAPDSPCANKVVLHLDPHLTGSGLDGLAVGILIAPDDSWTLQSCDIAVDPVQWAASSRYEDCRVYLHESLHLAGLRHSDTGVMRPDHDAWVPECATLRERIIHAIQTRTSGRNTFVQCGRWQARVLPCTSFLSWHSARFRVSVNAAGGFVVRRVHHRAARKAAGR